MRLLTWLDWRSIMRVMPLSDPASRALLPSFAEEDLRAAIHCAAPGGAILRGARAIRHLCLRMPALVPVALFMWAPGVIYVAERVYAVISRNRQVLGRWFGCEQACAYLPPRRPGDVDTRADL